MLAAEVLEHFKSFGMVPRDVQVQFVTEWCRTRKDFPVHAFYADVGVGKSGALRAIQIATDGSIVTSDNNLVDQYGASFPDLNVCKGKKRYKCVISENCAEHYSLTKQYCENCPYACARARVEMGDQTVFNPMSYKYFSDPAETLLIDEAHKLPGFLREIASTHIRISDLESVTPDVVIEQPRMLLKTLRKCLVQVQDLISVKEKRKDFEGIDDDRDLAKRFDKIITALDVCPEDFVVFPDVKNIKGQQVRVLQLQAVIAPENYTSVFEQSKQIVLASATIFPHHIRELIKKKKYRFIELPNVIPAENRRLIINPATVRTDKGTSVECYAKKIREIMQYKHHVGERGVIHATYEMAAALAPLLPDDVLTHDKQNKSDVLQRFISGEGRFLLAAGMAEGIDLKGDIARINIICKLQFPYFGDHYVKRRMDTKYYADGRLWYDACAIEHLRQAVGRTTRGADDRSISYLLDSRFSELDARVSRNAKAIGQPELYNQYLPKGFLETIKGG